MNKSNQKNLIISLIKDDLIHTKLVNGLEALGLDALDYHLYLSETIFELMNISDSESTEPIFEHYLAQLKKAKRLNIHKNRKPPKQKAAPKGAALNKSLHYRSNGSDVYSVTSIPQIQQN